MLKTVSRFLSLLTLVGIAGVATATTNSVVTVAGKGTGTCCGSGFTLYTDSGINLQAGQSASISASGVWDVCGHGCASDADGLGDYNAGMTGAPGDNVTGSLMGSLDGGATWTLIGVGPTSVVGPGELLLAANDWNRNINTCTQNGAPFPGSCYWDNTGSLTVSIAVSDPMPTDDNQCKNGGWRNFGVFKNQGDCVSYVHSHQH